MLPDHEIEIRVRYYETDAQGFVHHANYFVYFELARVEQLLRLGYDYAHLERDGILLVVNKIACKLPSPKQVRRHAAGAIRDGSRRGATDRPRVSCVAATNCWPRARARWRASTARAGAAVAGVFGENGGSAGD